MKIDKEFYKGDMEKPKAYNVGELIEQLKRLPLDMPIEQTFSEGCELVVFNIKRHTMHLQIADID